MHLHWSFVVGMLARVSKWRRYRICCISMQAVRRTAKFNRAFVHLSYSEINPFESGIKTVEMIYSLPDTNFPSFIHPSTSETPMKKLRNLPLSTTPLISPSLSQYLLDYVNKSLSHSSIDRFATIWSFPLHWMYMPNALYTYCTYSTFIVVIFWVTSRTMTSEAGEPALK